METRHGNKCKQANTEWSWLANNTEWSRHDIISVGGLKNLPKVRGAFSKFSDKAREQKRSRDSYAQVNNRFYFFSSWVRPATKRVSLMIRYDWVSVVLLKCLLENKRVWRRVKKSVKRDQYEDPRVVTERVTGWGHSGWENNCADQYILLPICAGWVPCCLLRAFLYNKLGYHGENWKLKKLAVWS